MKTIIQKVIRASIIVEKNIMKKLIKVYYVMLLLKKMTT